MIRIDITQEEKMRRIRVGDKLREVGFTQFSGTVTRTFDIATLCDVYVLHPTIKDLLTKRFKSNYTYPWQKRKEILFRKFI